MKRLLGWKFIALPLALGAVLAIAACGTEGDVSQAEFDSLAADVAEARTQIANQGNDIFAATSAAAAAQSAVDAIGVSASDLNALDRRLDGLDSANAQNAAAISSSGNEITALQADVAAAQRQIRGLQGDIDSLEAALASPAAAPSLVLGSTVHEPGRVTATVYVSGFKPGEGITLTLVFSDGSTFLQGAKLTADQGGNAWTDVTIIRNLEEGLYSLMASGASGSVASAPLVVAAK